MAKLQTDIERSTDDVECVWPSARAVSVPFFLFLLELCLIDLTPRAPHSTPPPQPSYLRERVTSLEATERTLRAELRKTRGGVAWQVPVDADADAGGKTEVADEVETTSSVDELIRLRRAIAYDPLPVSCSGRHSHPACQRSHRGDLFPLPRLKNAGKGAGVLPQTGVQR